MASIGPTVSMTTSGTSASSTVRRTRCSIAPSLGRARCVEPRRENLGRRRDQHRRHMRVAGARLRHDGARDVAHDGAVRRGCRTRSSPGCRISGRGRSTHSAKAPPASAASNASSESVSLSSAAEAARVITRRGNTTSIVTAHQPRTRDQRVLAGAARSDHQHEPARADPPGARLRASPRANCASQFMRRAARPARRRARPAHRSPRAPGSGRRACRPRSRRDRRARPPRPASW